MKITNDATMFLKVYGRLFKVLFVAKNTDEANKFCEEFPHCGVLAENKEDGLVYICDINDKGIPT